MNSQFNRLPVKLSQLLFIFAWAYRLKKLFLSIQTGILFDFINIYYHHAGSLIFGNTNAFNLARTSFGPPFVYLPFIPFALFPENIAEILITLTNLTAFFATIFLLIRKFRLKRNWVFWLLISSLAFSFPLIYSLGMGNPLGIVTLGIYIFWLSRSKFFNSFFFSISALLKLFPLAILPVIIRNFKKQLVFVFTSLSALILISFLLVPQESWSHYKNFSVEILSPAKLPNPAIHNQAFASVITRLDIHTSLFSIYYWIFSLAIIMPTLFILKEKLKTKIPPQKQLDLAMLLLSTTLLLHPYSWQYYYTIFLPFLILKILQGKYFYFPVYLLMSFNGNWVNLPLIQPILTNSQFLATLMLFIMLTKQKQPLVEE